MTEIDDVTAPFVEAEIKKNRAALTRQLIAVAIVICLMLMRIGLHH